MNYENVYEITVLALINNQQPVGMFRTEDVDIKKITYPVTFKILSQSLDQDCYLHANVYTVWCQTNNLHITCMQTYDFVTARRYIHAAMKLAMHGRFIFSTCTSCRSKIYYPETRCNQTIACSYYRRYITEWCVETQIEKIPKHLCDSFEDDRHKTDSAESLCSSPETTEELRIV